MAVRKVILPPAPPRYDLLDQNTVRSLVERALSSSALVTPHASQHEAGGTDVMDVAWSIISGQPTTLSGYGITDAYTQTAADALFLTQAAAASTYLTTAAAASTYLTIAAAASTYAPISHTHPWSEITSTPTTLSGYGITDAYTQAQADAAFAPITHTHAASQITAGEFPDSYTMVGTLGITGLVTAADITASGTATFEYRAKFEGHAYAAMYDVGDRATNYTVDWDNGIKQRIAATGNIQITVDDDDLSGGGYTLAITAKNGARTITFSGVSAWGGAGAHSNPVAQDDTLIVTIDAWGTTLIGYADVVTTPV